MRQSKEKNTLLKVKLKEGEEKNRVKIKITNKKL